MCVLPFDRMDRASLPVGVRSLSLHIAGRFRFCMSPDGADVAGTGTENASDAIRHRSADRRERQPPMDTSLSWLLDAGDEEDEAEGGTTSATTEGSRRRACTEGNAEEARGCTSAYGAREARGFSPALSGKASSCKPDLQGDGVAEAKGCKERAPPANDKDVADFSVNEKRAKSDRPPLGIRPHTKKAPKARPSHRDRAIKKAE